MYLVADPVPSGEVDFYEVDIDGVIVRADGEIAGSEIRLHYELPSSLSSGSHTATVKPVNAWGEGPISDPFVFSKGYPGAVSGLGLSEV